tara:strand:+ start:36 stop:647 length:612 start_codon:yes stop_codon:yes gene_type:complete
MIGIINFGYGNIQSIINALNDAEIKSKVLSKSTEVQKFEKLILPGVGSFKTCFEKLVEYGWKSEILEYIDNQKFLLGICLGMQLLFQWGEEDGGSNGLGIFKGKVKKIKIDNFGKLPHIGWNNIRLERESKLFKGINGNVDYYFIHTFECLPENKSEIIATTDYGARRIIASISNNKNVYGTQFHPEKSPPNGLKILNNFNSF